MFSYGHLQTPNCIGPQCFIKICNPDSLSSLPSIEIEAIVDTGAVMTCIPKSTIMKLVDLVDIVKGEPVYVRNADGSRREVETYYVELQIADLFLIKRIIVLPSKEYALLGRDVLNDYKVSLNAPIEQWILNCTEICN